MADCKIFLVSTNQWKYCTSLGGFIERDSIKLYSVLFTIMITKQIVNTIKQLVVPTTVVCCRRRTYISQSNEKKFIEHAFIRLKYDGLIDDYGEVIQQFSYLINYGAAFPLAPLISLVVNIVQNYGEFNLYLEHIQRPFAGKSAGIGRARIVVMEALGLMAVLINFYLLYSTLRNHLKTDKSNQWAHFLNNNNSFGWNILIIEHIIIAAKILLAVFIQDKPQWVLKEEKRRALARDRNIRRQMNLREETPVDSKQFFASAKQPRRHHQRAHRVVNGADKNCKRNLAGRSSLRGGIVDIMMGRWNLEVDRIA